MPNRRCLVLLATSLALVSLAGAQTPRFDIPRNVILLNHDAVLIGPREGLEGGAYIARTDDGAAAWYNPAGLARAEKTGFTAAASAWDNTTLTVEGFGSSSGGSRTSGTSTLTAAALVNMKFLPRGWRLGVALARPQSWSPSRIGADFTSPTGTAPIRVGYNTQVNFARIVPTVALAYAPSGAFRTFRVGGSVGLSKTSLAQDLALSARQTSSTQQRLQERTFGSDGTVLHLVASGGVQWDVQSTLTLGAQVTTAGLRLSGSSSLDYKDAYAEAGAISDLLFRDRQTRFALPVPWKAGIGIAKRFSRGAVELDVRRHGASGATALYTSERPGTLTVTSGGTAPVTTSVAFRDPILEFRAVTNASIGGHVAFSERFRVHIGGSTDRSPVVERQDRLFPRVNLLHLGGGVSLATKRVTGTFGVGHTRGNGAPSAIGGPESEGPIISAIKIRSLSVMYALGVLF